LWSLPAPKKAAAPYEAFALLPNRGRYQSLSEVEARLSFDLQALDALAAGCRQPSTQRAAWNLLLLGVGRYLWRYLHGKDPIELGALMGWLVEAVNRQQPPLSYLRRAACDYRRSRRASLAREEQLVREAIDDGATVALDGEDRVWSTPAVDVDPLLGRRLSAALARLSPPQREALLLSEVEERTGPEIAAQMGRSVGGVRNMIAEARKIVRDTLGEGSANE